MKTISCLCLIFFLTACSSPSHRLTKAKQPTTLRVLCYNIHHGAGMDGKLDLQRIADVINAANPDLVALQEVDNGCERTGGVDQPAVLAELTGMHAVFEKNIDFQGGEYGNAVLSKWPVKHHVNHKLPSHYEDEQRGLLEVHLMIGDRPVVFYATHFDYRGNSSERPASAEMLRNLIETQDVGTIIVAGDLNTRPDTAVMEQIRSFMIDSYDESQGPGYTFPADDPDRRIDYILHTPSAGFKVVESGVIDEALASDHRPLLVVFESMCE